MKTWSEQLSEFRNALTEAQAVFSEANRSMKKLNESMDLMARLIRRYEKEVKDEA